MSNTTNTRAWPRWHRSYTVMPQTYMRTWPGVSGTNSSLVRVRELVMCNMVRAGHERNDDMRESAGTPAVSAGSMLLESRLPRLNRAYHMALPRFLAAIAASVMLASGPVLAEEIQDIRQQFQQGNLAGALDGVDRYLAKTPGNAQARFLKALILADQGKSDAAIEVLTGLTEDYPELPEPYNNLAVIHAAQGRYESALNALEAAIRANPKYATAHENLGDIHAKMASAEYEKALALDSKNTTAQTKLTLMRTLLEHQGFDPAAAQSLKTAPEPAPP